MDSSSSGKRALADFREIVLDGIGSVHVVQGSEFNVGIEGESDGLLPAGAQVRDGTLYLDTGIGGGKIVIRSHPPVFRVTCPTLEQISINGAAKAYVTGLTMNRLTVSVDGAGVIQLNDLTLGHLHVQIGGAAKVSATGTAEQQDIQITGAGMFTGDELIGKRAKINIQGAGKAKVNAADELTISIGGVGSVYYLGNPRIEQSVGGLGRVKRA